MELTKEIDINRELGASICQRLNEEINKLGFAETEIQHYPHYDNASFVLIKDPYTGKRNLTCYWYEASGRQPVGRLQFNSDGTFYAEYDVVKTYPGKPKWFVEGVSAWGNAETIKAEARLLPMPG